MFCLALQLNIKTVNSYYVGRGVYDQLFNERYGVATGNHPLFRIIKHVKMFKNKPI